MNKLTTMEIGIQENGNTDRDGEKEFFIVMEM